MSRSSHYDCKGHKHQPTSKALCEHSPTPHWTSTYPILNYLQEPTPVLHLTSTYISFTFYLWTSKSTSRSPYYHCKGHEHQPRSNGLPKPSPTFHWTSIFISEIWWKFSNHEGHEPQSRLNGLQEPRHYILWTSTEFKLLFIEININIS